MRIPVRDVRASETKAGRVEMIEAQIDAFLRTDRQRQCLKQQGAALGIGCIEGATKLETVKHLGIDAFAKQESEGFVGKKLRRERSRPIGKAWAMQNHSGSSFAWRKQFLLIWHETFVNHGNQPSVLHHRSDQA